MPESALLIRSGAISTRIRVQDEAARLEGDASGFSSRADTLAQCVEAVSQARQLTLAFKAESVSVDWDAGQLQSLKARVIRLKGRYEANPAAILDANPTVWPVLEAFPAEAQRRLLVAWRGWLDSIWPPIDAETLATLAGIPELGPAVRGIQAYVGRRDALRAALPHGADDFTAVRRLGAATVEAWTALVGSGLPEEVVTFLEAANRGDATLPQLTDAVRDWLEIKHLADRVRLSMGSRGYGSR